MVKNSNIHLRINEKTKILFASRCLELDLEMSEYIQACIGNLINSYAVDEGEFAIKERLELLKKSKRERMIELLEIDQQIYLANQAMDKIHKKRSHEQKLMLDDQERNFMVEAKAQLAQNPGFLEGKVMYFNNQFARDFSKTDFIEVLNKI